MTYSVTDSDPTVMIGNHPRVRVESVAAIRSESIVDIVSARASSEELAYVFLADGTSETEIRWTFADTAEKAGAFTAHLTDRGIGPGDRVVVAVNPSLDYVAALYGIMATGAAAVPCFPPLRPKEVGRFEAIVRDSTPKAIVVNEMYRVHIEARANSLESSASPVPVIYAEQVPTSAATGVVASPAPGDPALIQYTSGSTGSPKGVCITHDNLISNCEALRRRIGDDPLRVGLSWLPPYHDMGLIGTIIMSMYDASPLVLMSPLHFVQDPRRWLTAITHYRATITVGPNFALDLCARALSDQQPQDYDLSSVKELFCGAEPIHPGTLARFTQTVAPLGFDEQALVPCYGLAEATLFVAGTPPGSRYRTTTIPEKSQTDRVTVSCGAVDSEHTVRIVDTVTLTTVDDGCIGEIWVAGRSVAAGYLSHPELTSEVFHARLNGDDRGYLRTGDLGFVRSGELFVTGRIKDLIIVDGRNIYPQDVEATAVAADPTIHRAVAFSIDGISGEQLCVVAEVSSEEGDLASYRGIRNSVVRDVTSEFAVSPQVHLCPKRSIPTTTSGKVRRQPSKQAFLDGTFRCFDLEAAGCRA